MRIKSDLCLGLKGEVEFRFMKAKIMHFKDKNAFQRGGLHFSTPSS